MRNKIHYGITNVFYRVCTETLGTNGQYTETYATPVRLLGARSISMPAQNENVNFPADNDPNYWRQNVFSGYEGTLTLATLEDDFRKAVLGEKQDTNSLVGESLNDKPVPFALIFQFEGDDKATRHVLYRCIAGKPDIDSETRDTTITPNEISIPITAGGRLSDGLVKWKALATATTAYNGWNNAVYVPTFSV